MLAVTWLGWETSADYDPEISRNDLYLYPSCRLDWSKSFENQAPYSNHLIFSRNKN